ncbi:MAG: hypothetical protein DRO36_06510, partial [Candidatus Hecatellales archaeon]
MVYYNDAGDVVRREVWDGSGTRRVTYEASYDYGALGALQWDRDAGGRKTLYTSYDALERVTAFRYADTDEGEDYTYDYDASGNVIRFSTPEGTWIERTYDALGNVITRNENGRVTRYEYTEDGLLEWTVQDAVTMADGGSAYPVTQNVYDERRRLVEIRRGWTSDAGIKPLADEMETVRKITLDENSDTVAIANVQSDVVMTRDINGNGILDEEEVDRQGRVKKVKDLLGRITTTAYTNAGEISTKTDALGNITTFKHDGEGRDAGRTLADEVNDTAKTYTREGWLKTKRDGAGNTLEWTYSAIGELEQIAVNGIPARRILSRDALGRIVSVEENSNSTAPVRTDYEYYPDSNRLYKERVTVEDLTYEIAYTYDADGRLKQIVYPSGREAGYTYTAQGYVDTIMYDGSEAAAYTYDGERVSCKTLGIGIVTCDYGSDWRDYLSSVTVRTAGGVTVDRRYQRKADGRIVEIEDLLKPAESVQYVYGDDLGQSTQGYRLMRVLEGGEQKETFFYDIMGNHAGAVSETPFPVIDDAVI